ncbi:MAG: hypothetical protein QOJ07_1458, partial [Thermoleophilaceae bacterium]|nr:hypothetical protein [Thermoleophilaceae bacterium]
MTRADAIPIADGLADGLWVAGADGTILYVNASGLRMLGYADGELIGRDSHAAVHHSYPDGSPFPLAECPLRAVGETGASYETDEDCFWRKDGSALHVACSSSPVPLTDGAGTVVVFRDVTAQRAGAAAAREAVLAARRSETLHRTLTANLPDTSVFLLDRDLRILVADGAAIRRLPWYGDEVFRGRKVAELYAQVPDHVLQLCLTNYRAALEGERRAFGFQSEGLTFDIQAVPVAGDDGSIESVLVVARDVSERARVEEQVVRRARQQDAVAELGRFALESHDLGELMMEASATATAALGLDLGGILRLDEGGESLTVAATVGFPDGALDGARVPYGNSAAGHTLGASEPTLVDDLAAETRFEPSALLRSLGVVSSATVPIEGQGTQFGVLSVHSREHRAFADDEVAFLCAVARLVTVAVGRDREEEATRHASLHDPLTGLPNRRLALDRLAHALARRRREHIDVAVFVLDVDRFKIINDSFGHAAGDEVLLAIAPRLAAAVRGSDTVARLGGDEFVVICPDVDGARGATEAAGRLASAVGGALVLSTGEHSFTISTGIALAAGRQDTPESLLGNADAAMYRAK